MHIYKEIYDLIVARSSKKTTHELGGALGCDRSGDICFVEFENPKFKDQWYTYVPNKDYLNKITAGWPPHFEFAGVFHIHTDKHYLSVADIDSFKNILSAMPSEINMLHFPLYVLSDGRLYGFKLKRIEDGSIEITNEPITII